MQKRILYENQFSPYNIPVGHFWRKATVKKSNVNVNHSIIVE